MDLECPYCEEELEINHDDGFGYEEGVTHQMECSHCEKSFVFYTSVSYHYEPEKADCLNGAKCDWKITTTFPKFWSKMECIMCGERRELTDAEKVEHNIPTKEEYMKEINSGH